MLRRCRPGGGTLVWRIVSADTTTLMPVETIGSWRELDDAIQDPGFGRHEHRVHSTLVFRGLGGAAVSSVSSLARLSGRYERLERHLIRNFRKYAHRER